MHKIVITIIIFLVVISLVASVGGMHENKGMVTVQRMCAVPMNGTAYDCSEHWAMVYYQDMYNVQTPKEQWASGFAVYGDQVRDGGEWSICKFFPKIRDAGEENCSIKWLAVGKYKRDGCWDETCYPLVWHEMKHLACECDWHKNMDSGSSFRNVILTGTGNA